MGGDFSFDRVLAVRLSSLGDIVRAVPSLCRLKENCSHLSLLVEDRFSAAAELYPVPDKVIAFPRKRLSFGSFREFIGDLRSESYDLCLDLHGILKSAILSRMARASATAGYGRGFGREFSHLFYSRRLSCGNDTRISRYQRYAGALDALGIPAHAGTGYYPPSPGEEALAFAADFLKREGLEPGGFVTLFPGASLKQSFKRWPMDRFVRLAELVQEELGARTLFSFGPEEAQLKASVDGVRGASVLDAVGLRNTAAVIMSSSAFVGADTGLMHMAALGGVRTVALMGATDPVLNRPWGERCAVLTGGGQGMSGIPAEEVLDRLSTLLDL